MPRSPAGPGVTVTLRKVSTGHKVCAFSMEDMNHAYSFAKILVRSPEYNRCYAVATDWQGETLFNVQPEGVNPAPYQMPAPPAQFPAPPQAYPHPNMYPQQYALPAYPQQQYPQQPAYPPTAPHEYRAVPVYEQYGPAPGYPALPGRR